MNESPFLTNTFEGGVVADLDKDKVPKNIMTYALNGRVVFNNAGTLSFNNAAGNSLAINLGFNYGVAQARPYTVIGGIEISNYLILFSTQNNYTDIPNNRGYSEIGLLTENQPGVFAYQTIFNDQYDPNGQQMHLNSRFQIKARAILENKNTIRVYWCDDYNEDRVFNVVSGLNPYINPVTGITYFATPYAAPYPYWYSVHGMAELCDVQFGLIKYQKNIPGAKIAGVRQYFYRLVHMSGYATPWSTGSGMIFVTVPEVNVTDWTQYAMVNSGTLTPKGHQLEIKYIDTRFTYIEVAWAYYSSNVAPQSAGIFFQGLITGTSMIVSDVNEQVVVPIPDPTVLIQRYADVLHSKTLEINENYHHKANVFLRPILEINTEAITIEPIIRQMGSDATQNVSAIPLTNGLTTTNDSVNVQLFEQGTNVPYYENYVIGDNVANGSLDYINYKGTQWDCLFKGEFRGQTVPFAIVLFSRKGQPFFAQHIGDFTMPEQYDNTWRNEKLIAGAPVPTTGTNRNNGIPAAVGDYTLTNFAGSGALTNNINQIALNGVPALNILGKLVSGIDLTDVLYDNYGDLQISGFSIVRADRIPNLIAQGLVINCSNFAGQQNLPMLNSGNFITPLHSTGNAYFDAPSGTVIPLPLPSYKAYQKDAIDHGGYDTNTWGLPGSPSGDTPPVLIAANYFTLELPDNLINPATITQEQQSGYNLKLVGNVQGSFIQQVTGPDACNGSSQTGTLPTQLAFTSFYTKNYITQLPNGPVTPGLALTRSTQGTSGTTNVGFSNNPGDFGSIMDIERIWTPSVSTVGQSTGIDNFQYSSVAYLQEFGTADGINIKCDGIYHALGTDNQVVIKSSEYANACLEANEVVLGIGGATLVPTPNPVCYYLANVITGQPTVLNESIIANRIYKNIGHFVPINPTIVAAATQSNGRVVFNDCEVWGGDCYVDYFGYGRLIPLYDNVKPASQTPAYYDYGCGLIFPCETVNNHTMRIGNSFPSVALRPGIDETPSKAVNQVFNSGLYYNFNDSTDARIEDFELNAVMQATDQIEAYNVKGIYYVDEPDQPLLEMVSNIKIPGETYDNFRLFLVNNNQPADSQYGWICDLESVGHNLYVLQEKGFGRVRFNEFQQQVQPGLGDLTIGTGQGYQGHIYMGGAEFGCQHEFSVYNVKNKAIYWVNAYEGKDCRFAGNGLECLSDTHGQHTYYTENAEQYWQIPYPDLQDLNENIFDNPVSVGGISTIYDYRNHAKINSFTQQLMVTGGPAPIVQPNPDIIPTTMEYNDSQESYQGNWDYNCGIYFGFKKDFFAPQGASFYEFNIGAKGNFFGVVYPSELEFIVRAERQNVFDVMELDIQPSAFAALKTFTGTTVNGSQQVNFNDPADTRPIYRNSCAIFPAMEIAQSTRLRGSYLDVKFTIDNTNNIDLLASEARTFVRQDFR